MNIHRKDKFLYRQNNQRGIALVMAMVVLFVFSVLGAGVMFSTQTEMWNSANLRGTTQARYVAEAGVSQALNWLNSTSFAWTNISTTFLDTTKCNYSVIPVTCSVNNTPLVIGTNAGGVTDTWATLDSTVADFGSQDQAFRALSTNSATSLWTYIPSGSLFKVSAQLLQLNQVSAGLIRAKWKLISVGSVPGIAGRSSSVQVEEIVENTQYVNSGGGGSQMFTNALAATGTGCNTVSLNGGGTTGSYNSTLNPPGTLPASAYTSGNIASNGNVSISQGYYIGGKLLSPLSGVDSGQSHWVGGTQTYWGTANGYASTPGTAANGWGATGMGCDATHMYAVNEDNSGSAITGGLATPINQLSNCWTSGGSCPAGYNTTTYQALPTMANATMTAAASDVACTADPACGGGNINWNATNTGTWNASGGIGTTHEQILSSGAFAFSLPPSDTIDYGNVNPPNSGLEMHLSPGTYNFNSLQLSDKIVIDLPAVCTTSTAKTSDPGCRVTINIVGEPNAGDTAVYVNGGSLTNSSGRPGNLLIQYNGLGNVNITAGAAMYATIYAPNASFNMSGGVGLYGGVVAKTATITNPNGSTPMISYDVSLASDGPQLPGGNTPGITPFHVDEFSWSAY